MERSTGEITGLLHAWAAGDRSVEERLFALVLPDLHRLAQCLMRGERPDHSLQPTALLDEVYCRLVAARERNWENRKHFFAVAARAMRRLLIDHARSRPKVHKIPLEDVEAASSSPQEKLALALSIDGLLDEMRATQPDSCSIVELRFFMGFTDREAADALGLPLRTIQRRFSDARRWLYERLESKPCPAHTKTTNS